MRLPATLLSALALLTACATTPPPQSRDLYVMRHLLKAEGQDPPLSALGQACATALARTLFDRGIRTIYVSTTARSRQTAGPLAARLGLTPVEYDPRDTPALTARVRAEAGTTLVVGHSNTVPDIVEGLGGPRPGDLDETRYGEIWRMAANGTVTMMRIEGC